MSMKQMLARFVFPYGSRRRVVRGPVRGMSFIVELGIGASYALGTDAAAPRHYEQWIQPGMTVYDLGANKGQMTLLFAALVGRTGRVVALEPAPAEFASLRRNVEMNHLACVKPMQVAGGESEGEIMFAYYPESPTQGKLLEIARIHGDTGEGAFSVRTLPLDSLLKDEPPPDVIKLDVEGAAASVLRGATRILTEVCPRIYVEFHSLEERVAVVDELFTRGYVAKTIDGEVVTDPINGCQLPLWCYKPSLHEVL